MEWDKVNPRRDRLEHRRIDAAVEAITKLGYSIDYRDNTTIRFQHRGETVTYFPYTGWATGKTITDGRGLLTLLHQLDNLKA